ncbi:MAG: tRNA 5-carboxymethoxyuridine methyltransferase [Chlamydiia bacterium]|nr:tRNA 5-carboxymethoxyuridine methyltransferase [Chlamydiia bacterium]MCH9619050.1 tRNA 5-carboxymethoxyuridine methyltransferase [Chlamydiia bacterium]MCH9623730.1 tRNA 5-carboxymethoxyuridine methyltransferase [Chlamydiia bacterium]
MPVLLSTSTPSTPPSDRLSFWEQIKGYKTLCPLSHHFTFNATMENSRITKYVAKCIEKFIQSPPEKVLDLGGGVGANTLALSAGGAYVTIIDKSNPLLKQVKKARKIAKIPADQIRIIHNDITKINSYGTNYGLIIAVDLFPYLAPKALEPTMRKIYKSLCEGGILVGTISTTSSIAEEMQPLMRKMGHHIYDGDQTFVRRFLEESGLSVQKIHARDLDDGGGFEFEAKKISPFLNPPPVEHNIAFAADKCVQKYIEHPPTTVLDLASGVGNNSLPMAKKGAFVTVIEKEKKLLHQLGLRCEKEKIPQEQIRRIYNNITGMESFGNNYDLVIAINILGYLPEYTLTDTMLKIFTCMRKGGILIATLPTNESLEQGLVELSERMNQQIYQDGEPFIRNLIQASGLTVKKIEKRSPEDGGGFVFEARKTVRLGDSE